MMNVAVIVTKKKFKQTKLNNAQKGKGKARTITISESESHFSTTASQASQATYNTFGVVSAK